MKIVFAFQRLFLKMSQVSDRDVEAIKEWLAKESHLPKTFDDMILKKFLFSCHCSLEKTKKCIDEYCTRRANMPEVFTKRDPLSKNLQNIFSITSVTTYMDGKNEILIYLLKDVPDDFNFYDCVKTFTTQVDNWINIKIDSLPENHITVVDIKNFTLKLMTKLNILYLKMFLTFLLESMPLRLKNIHFINCPPFYEYMYNLVKPAFPEYVINLMQFHHDHTGIYKFINKASLPKEYGGESQSMEEQNAYWINMISEKRQFYLDDNLWRADLSQKVKNKKSDNSMNGSFKTLEID